MRYTLILGRKRIKIFEKGSIAQDECDRIIKKNQLSLPGGIILPVALEIETARACTLSPVQLSPAVAVDLAIQNLEGVLSGTEQVVDRRFSATQTADAVSVEMIAECIKQIGVEQIPPEGE